MESPANHHLEVLGTLEYCSTNANQRDKLVLSRYDCYCVCEDAFSILKLACFEGNSNRSYWVSNKGKVIPISLAGITVHLHGSVFDGVNDEGFIRLNVPHDIDIVRFTDSIVSQPLRCSASGAQTHHQFDSKAGTTLEVSVESVLLNTGR